MCRNEPVPLLRNSHVSGFGCSNEAIARLSGRPRNGSFLALVCTMLFIGRGRRAAVSERRQGGSSRSDSPRTHGDVRDGTRANDSFLTSPSDASKTAVGSKISNNNNAQYAFNPFTAPPPSAELQSEAKNKQKSKLSMFTLPLQFF